MTKHRRYWRNKRAKALQMLGNQCVRCGITDHRVLQIDHITPLLRNQSGKDYKDTAQQVLQSAAMCQDIDAIYQLLCANCHQIKTYHDGKEHLQSIESIENKEEILPLWQKVL